MEKHLFEGITANDHRALSRIISRIEFEDSIEDDFFIDNKFEDEYHTGIQRKEPDNKFTRYEYCSEIRKELYNIWEKLCLIVVVVIVNLVLIFL